MANNWFQFKQFLVRQNPEVFSVNTDGVLLGAWTPVDACQSALDVGTGTGVIALMLAQRGVERVSAIDLRAEAVAQARENLEGSSWPKRFDLQQSDLADYQPEHRFDLLISNPPFFSNAFRPESAMKDLARHNHALPFSTIIQAADRLLEPTGKLSLILPVDEGQRFEELAAQAGWYCVQKCVVFPTNRKEANRWMMLFQREQEALVTSELIIRNEQDHSYTEAYRNLTKDFYLAF